MVRAERGEEAATLLAAYQQAAQRDVDRSSRQRRHALRTAFGVIGAVALVVGCIAAVDVLTLNGGGGGNPVETTTLDVSAPAGGDGEAVAMESQFGWSSVSYGWCSTKAAMWCLFSKDKAKCEESMACGGATPDETHQNHQSGSGSGGNHSYSEVGDHSSSGGGETINYMASNSSKEGSQANEDQSWVVTETREPPLGHMKWSGPEVHVTASLPTYAEDGGADGDTTDSASPTDKSSTNSTNTDDSQ
ncbi:hypothetical protein BBJ28_00017838 [Nothophytophthora sp. Chile5]|nr:hypothetical protein BBJ28_00017838 [Nothophytophthora sp. Chile5]